MKGKMCSTKMCSSFSELLHVATASQLSQQPCKGSRPRRPSEPSECKKLFHPVFQSKRGASDGLTHRSAKQIWVPLSKVCAGRCAFLCLFGCCISSFVSELPSHCSAATAAMVESSRTE